MNAIQTDELRKSYGDIDAVAGLTLEVERGEIYGFLGPNGAGKSTTIGILATLISPDSGRALVDSIDIRRNPQEAKRRIAVLFQESTLDRDLNVSDNLVLYARLQGLRKRDAVRAMQAGLELVGLSDKVDSPVSALSGGMRRRVELARALITQPAVLFLDEPTTGLDVQTRALVWDYLRRTADEFGITVFLTTHQLSEADHCHRIMIIDNGSTIAEGTPDELRAGLGGDILRFATTDNERVVRGITDVLGRNAVIRNGYIEVAGPSVAELLPRVLQLGDVTTTHIEVKRPSLDDVFLHYTGTRIRDEQDIGSLEKVVIDGHNST